MKKAGEKTTPRIETFPTRLVLELTPLCNLSCFMCPRHYVEAEKGYMSPDLWKRLIDEVAKNSPQTIILPFWRGESLLHRDFSELLDYALQKSLRIHLCTNGERLREADLKTLSRLEFVTFSLHTPKGFEHAKEFLAFRKEGRPVTQVSFVDVESSRNILSELVADPLLGGFDSVRLYREHTKDGVFGRSGRLADVGRTFCPKLIDTLVVAYDGTISRCNHIWDTDKALSVNELSILDVWNSAAMERIREDYPDGGCGPCDQWTGHTCGESWRLVDGVVEHQVFGEPSPVR